MRRVAQRLVQVVQHGDQSAALPLQLGAQLQDLDLVGDIEVGGGLVQQQQRSLLRQRHGDPGALSLTSGELVHRTPGQLGHMRGLKRLPDGRLVLTTPALEQALVRMASARDEIRDGDAVRGDRALRKQPDRPGQGLRGNRPDGLSVEQHVPGRGPDEPGQAAQQRGLAAGIGADDHGERALGHLEIKVLEDSPLVVPGMYAFGAQLVRLHAVSR